MSNIVEKIKKLLRLSEDPTNEHVAEAAAQKAQELIAEHNIKGEMLVDKDDKQPTREDPKWQGFVVRNKRVQTWSVNLASHLARNNYGKIGIMSGVGIKYLGAKSDYEVVCAMYNWIAKQLHDMAMRNTHGVRESNSYKLGAITTIGKRLDQAKKDTEAKLEIEAMMDEVDGNNGLVLYKNAITALNDYTDKVDAEANRLMGGSWRGRGGSSDMSAYSRGLSDGNNVSLTGHQLKG